MAIRAVAFVDPKGINDIRSKIRQSHDDLAKVIAELKKGLENLNSSGFKDAKFNELKMKLATQSTDLQNLLSFMLRHEAYLKSQEMHVMEYINSHKLK
jgi:hypothetical protein